MTGPQSAEAVRAGDARTCGLAGEELVTSALMLAYPNWPEMWMPRVQNMADARRPILSRSMT